MISTDELVKRYGVNRNQIIKRKRSLEEKGFKIETVTLNRKACVDEHTLAMLDLQHEHIEAGGSLKTFEIPIVPDVIERMSRQDTIYDTVGGALENTDQGAIEQTFGNAVQAEIKVSHDSIQDLAIALAHVVKATQSKPNPILNQRYLLEAAEFRYQLTTSEVKELIGVKPKLKKGELFYKRGGWTFAKVGKIGMEFAWVVSRNDINQTQKEIDKT